MDQDKQSRLLKFTNAAKAVIYDPARMEKFMQLLGTVDGAVTAAKTVVAAIDQASPVPDDVAPLIAVNSYMLMVDVAQEVMGLKPSPKIIQQVIAAILKDYAEHSAQPAQPPAPQAAPGGLLAQGVA